MKISVLSLMLGWFASAWLPVPGAVKAAALRAAGAARAAIVSIAAPARSPGR